MTGAAAFDPVGFVARWNAWYPASVPVGYAMREAYADRWSRVYSLPEGRRHPTDDADWVVLLARHNAVAAAVLGSGASCVVVAALSSPDSPSEEWLRRRASLVPLPPIAPHREDVPDAEDQVVPFELYAAPVRWERGAVDDVLRARADDRLGPLLFANDAGHVYAPYDGGADVFFPTAAAREAFRTRFADWLPTHPQGL